MNIKRIFFISLIIVFSTTINAQNRSIWATIWSINTAEKIDKLIDTSVKYGFNRIFIQTRYRGDALYIPNKTNNKYINTESQSYILKGTDFDPLGYILEKLKDSEIEVHAWVPVFVITPHDLNKINSNHIYYARKDWVTVDNNGITMPYNTHEGAFLDAGIPEVQKYTLNVIGDIASNYNIDGIQLDYIRYPGSEYGRNPIAIEAYKNDSIALKDKNNKKTHFSIFENYDFGLWKKHQRQNKLKQFDDFDTWKQNQIYSFVEKTYKMIKSINPDIQVSAAVFADQQKAVGMFSQNWKLWIDNSIIDHIYVMAYASSDNTFKKSIEEIKEVDKKKTTIILRAWEGNSPYHASDINRKINISKDYNFTNLGFYSYSGMITKGYLKKLKIKNEI